MAEVEPKLLDNPIPAPLHVLHVEDADADAELIAHELRREWPTCEILHVSSQAAYVAALNDHPVDVVLSDFGLPGFDGLQALKLLRSSHPEIPFILVSGTIGEEQAVRALKAGAVDYVLKDRPARLGLRGVEVVRLHLDDIDWENAQLTVRSKKGGGSARLPMPADVGRAIADYLRRDRPTCTCRNVFVRCVAPHAALNNSAVIGLRVRAAMRRAGLKSPRQGAHVFRHTLASEMLRHGASLDEIARLLRHKDHDSTAIYAKVDLCALRRLVVALPGGAS